MANTAKEIAYNAAVVAAAAAFDDMMDGRTVARAADNGPVQLLPCTQSIGAASTAMETNTMVATTAGQKFRVMAPIKVASSNANNEYLIRSPHIAEILGGMPMFWYVTNAAGEVDVA